MDVEAVLIAVSAALVGSGCAAIAIGLWQMHRAGPRDRGRTRTQQPDVPAWERVFTPQELARLRALKERLSRHEVQR